MRITDKSSANMSIYNLNEGRVKLDHLNELISTSRLVNRPSDDPTATKKILEVESQVKSTSQYINNIKTGQTWLSMAGASLEGLLNSVMSVKSVAGQAVGGINDPIKKADMLSQLQAFREQLIDYPNAQVGGQYVFSGFNSDKQPFDAAGNFQGTEDTISIEVGKGVQVPVNVTGGTVLRGGTPPGSTGTDLIGTLDSLISNITSGNTAGIQADNLALDKGTQQLLGVVSDIGMRKARMDNALSAQQRSLNVLTEIHDNMQNVDYAKTAIQLTNQKTAFDAALAATAKIAPLSLLNYL